MSGGEEQPECPLCMEPLEIDDVSFYPCTCGYQICRFCWHRIRTNENGLCPACRKAYPEDPAEFKPLTDDEVHRIKKDRRQKESQRKQKSAESRKHLANVRVVQKNLVFVVGLASRLCDAETLRRHEYFGKFGKIHKVVINQSTSYVGSQGPSASAYVTYFRPEDAIAAIRAVNNLQVDGRTLKASLGTTKYCSHFLKGTQCMKPDCMYLHDYGDEAASFTKEEIQQGKHLVYEQKLYDQFVNCIVPSSNSPDQMKSGKVKDASPPDSGQLSPVSPAPLEIVTATTTANVTSVSSSVPLSSECGDSSMGTPNGLIIPNGSSVPLLRHMAFGPPSLPNNLSLFSDNGFSSSHHLKPGVQQATENGAVQPSSEIPDAVLSTRSDSWQTALNVTSSNNNTTTSAPTVDTSQDDDLGFDPWDVSAKALADLIEKEKVVSASPIYRPVQAPLPHIVPPPTLTSGFSLSASMNNMHGFNQSRLKLMPPGFSQNGFAANLSNNMHQPVLSSLYQQAQHRSKMLGLMQQQQQQQQQVDNSAVTVGGGSGSTVGGSQSPGSGPQTPQHQPPIPRMPMHQPFQSGAARNLFMNPTEPLMPHSSNSVFYHRPPPSDTYMWRDWQEGLKALLPNVNISFGNPNHSSFAGSGRNLTQSNGFLPTQSASGGLHSNSQAARDKNWCSRSVPDLSWDPAIVNSGDVASTDNQIDDVQPHWMASLHHLTEDTMPHTNSHQSLGFGGINSFNQSPGSSSSSSWFPQHHSSRIHPPGFGLTSPTHPGLPNAAADAQLFGEHQLSA